MLSFVILLLILSLVITELQEEEPTRPMGESPSMAQMQNKQNRDQQYLAVRVNRNQPMDSATYKTDSGMLSSNGVRGP